MNKKRNIFKIILFLLGLLILLVILSKVFIPKNNTVEAGIQSLIAFIVGGRMQHGIIHQPVVIPMQHFSDEKEIRL